MEALRIWDNPDFGEVRTLEERGKVLYCGRDVARALGYSNTKDALSRHCRGVVKRDLIEEDKRFIEIYIALVKEYAVRYGVSVPATLEAKGKAALNAGTSRAASELN